MFSVVIPAFDEAATVGAVVRSVVGCEGARVIVVDDGSRDETAARAREAGAEVVRLEGNRGKGAALDAGVVAAGECEWLVFLDADLLGMDPAKVDALVRPVERGAVMCVGVRHGVYHLLNRRSRWVPVIAKLSGQRCVSRRLWEAARADARGFGVESALNFHASRLGEIAYVHLPGLRHTIKERKRGARAGLAQRARMVREVAATAIGLRWRRRRGAGR